MCVVLCSDNTDKLIVQILLATVRWGQKVPEVVPLRAFKTDFETLRGGVVVLLKNK